MAFPKADGSFIHSYLEFSCIITYTDNYSNIPSLLNYQCLFLRKDISCSRSVETDKNCFDVRIVECAERITEKEILEKCVMRIKDGSNFCK